jgi:predicted Zn-dependent peptidase
MSWKAQLFSRFYRSDRYALASTIEEEQTMTEEVRNIRRGKLSNGMMVLTEEMPHLRSVSIGVWVRTGSRHEELEVNGISHFLEHMVFKGTTSRSAAAIARDVDSIGGNMDAFTGKECICFNIKVLDEHLGRAMDVLSDMVLHPVFAAEDVQRERGVILEEIKMDEDNPDYLVHEIFTQNFWKDHPLGKPIGGTKETVKNFDQKLVRKYYERTIHPQNLILAAAGNLRHEQFVALAEKMFGGLEGRRNGFRELPPTVSPHITLRNKKSLEQVQICVGVPSHPISHEKRYASYVMNTMLGGGMSSRLFQNIREDKGLVYAIFSELSPFRDSGCLSVYAGASLGNAPKVVEEVVKEFRAIKEAPVPADELRRAKDQLKGSLMLSLESSSSRMSNLARQEMYFGQFFSMDEILARVEEVSAEDVQQMASELFHTDKVAVTILGNLAKLKIKRDQLAC